MGLIDRRVHGQLATKPRRSEITQEIGAGGKNQ
jgi:hypothetical protein